MIGTPLASTSGFGLAPLVAAVVLPVHPQYARKNIVATIVVMMEILIFMWGFRKADYSPGVTPRACHLAVFVR